MNCARRTRRFIPACAGNSAPAKASSVSATVHPRVCGEQRRRRDLRRAGDGSSPRVRGTALLARSDAVPSRFIPACAGNRYCAAERPVCAAVHPRVCGEQCCWTNTGRFIPACAGNRDQQKAHSTYGAVHPRVCGEQKQHDVGVNPRSGSSPRVRETATPTMIYLW